MEFQQIIAFSIKYYKEFYTLDISYIFAYYVYFMRSSISKFSRNP